LPRRPWGGISHSAFHPDEKEKAMKAIIRKYSGQGASQLIDAIEAHSAEVQSVIGSVKGVTYYALVRTADQAGIDESTQRAREWIAENAGEIGAAAPEVSAGDVVIQIG
jgi:rhamnogalacturonyl hydrolase YesR